MTPITTFPTRSALLSPTLPLPPPVESPLLPYRWGIDLITA